MADTTTPAGLINLALKMAGVIGVGQTAQAEDVNDAFQLLQMMLEQWRQQRWLVYHLVDTSVVSTGSQTYTVGSGGDFNVTRPDMLNAAYFRQLYNAQQPVDFPLTIIPSREDYNLIVIKKLGIYPQYCFYDATYPLGTLYLFPIPSAGEFELHITTKETLSVTSLTQTFNLPPEYQAAMFWNLASQLREMFQMPPSPKIEGMARSSLETIRVANAQVPLAQTPSLPGEPAWYNVWSDTVG